MVKRVPLVSGGVIVNREVSLDGVRSDKWLSELTSGCVQMSDGEEGRPSGGRCGSH